MSLPVACWASTNELSINAAVSEGAVGKFAYHHQHGHHQRRPLPPLADVHCSTLLLFAAEIIIYWCGGLPRNTRCQEQLELILSSFCLFKTRYLLLISSKTVLGEKMDIVALVYCFDCFE